MSDMVQIIDQSRKLSVDNTTRERMPIGVMPVVFMARAGMQMPPWWSPSRDISLRRFWKSVDYLSGAVYTMQAKMSAIPFRILARNAAVREHVQQAEKMTEYLYGTSQFGEGWAAFLMPWLEDLLCQDNGFFAEIVGFGDKTGPVEGAPLSVVHLDAARCIRTGNSEYPILFQDMDGKLHKMHYSRVMFGSQMRSPIKEMFGVGMSAISRCVNVSQTLLDVLNFKQEKLGSRPHRAIIIPSGGLDPSDVQSAFALAESALDSMGLSRYSKIVVAGSSSLPEAKLDVVELSSLPDGFDERTSVELGMATIALAFGVDARELFPSSQSGATRAEALLQHLKQRGKAPGQIIQTIEMGFDQKYLPPHLMLSFDFQDDAQDRQVADIRKVRADRRLQDMNTGVMDERTMREQMVESGDMTRSQFERLELTDGRLPDGASVLSLFYSNERKLKELLNVGSDDPLDLNGNDAAAMLQVLHEKMVEAQTLIANETEEDERYYQRQAMSALFFLQQVYLNPGVDILANSSGYKSYAPPVVPGSEEAGGDKADRIDGRVRGQELTNPDENEEMQSQRGSTLDSLDEEDDKRA